MHDVPVIEPAGHRQLTSRCAWCRLNPDKQAVGGVVQQGVAVNVGPDAAVVGCKRNRLERRCREGGFFKAVRVRGHRRVFAAADGVEVDARASLYHRDRVDNLIDRVDIELAPAVLDRSEGHVIHEDALSLVIDATFGIVHIATEDQSAPITGLRCCRNRGGVATDRLVTPGCHRHVLERRAENLQSGAATIDGQR